MIAGTALRTTTRSDALHAQARDLCVQELIPHASPSDIRSMPKKLSVVYILFSYYRFLECFAISRYNCRFASKGRCGWPFKCAAEPLYRLCQINASLKSNSISFSAHVLVGRLCRNIIISWKSIFTNLSDHFTRSAAQT